ncbi:lipopolysaccharide-induced tumor necrosis factor-alpha factor homolog [Anoplophora glabripennis]|uniref:lipopolysaccharide-induced tumor necrosis factor-alpha factor homolog n=1 Tax=Anoplophora glabripennis TaxID=217634 RepID=UPI0008740DC1|nr:lipopolysaccharide-induced tumor necrosis factor-alpha factor homolog [Anoplophora glabripennis]
MDKGPPPPHFQPPPPHFQPPPPQPQVIITQPTVLVLGPQPSRITCPSCHAQVTTNVVLENSTKTHLFAVLLCLICCPCVFIPYCTDSCKSKNHYCPNCQAYLGSFSD